MKIKEIIGLLDNNEFEYSFYGDDTTNINGVSSFVDYKEGTLAWVKNCKLYSENKEKGPKNPALLCMDSETYTISDYTNVIVCSNPKFYYSFIASHLFNQYDVEAGIGENTFIDATAVLGDNVHIGNNCTIGKNVIIGENTKIYNNVVLNDNTIIGKNCLIRSNVVIGEEGFGLAENEGIIIRMPHLGKVRIGDDVEIGSASVIDRGVFEDTIIENRVKISNSVSVAHNCYIENNVVISGGVTICGSVHIGEGAYISPGCVILNKKTIGKNAIIGIGSVLGEDAEVETVYMGNPARAIMKDTVFGGDYRKKMF